ncbi:MAG: toll/interleukin-1 receptor domain-containing protein [Eubacterium sp.]|nr:toll/interleukin-1 receptor domain-containing protein [Eubacterium sp.]
MSGVTLHIYEHEKRDIISMWNTQLKSIQRVLPRDYTENDIIAMLKLFYPHEWHSVEIKYRYYKIKDKYIKRHFGKTRYNMKQPKELLNSSSMFRRLLSDECRDLYATNYSEKEVNELIGELWDKRKPKIEKINQKIERAKSKTQQVTPQFINQLIGLYERKNTSQKDKMYILAELQKYYNPAVIQFFLKQNDTELNKQLRWIAFYHLQSFNYHPRARRQKYMQIHTRNKKRKEYLKRVYPDERHTIPKTPMELEYRIENAKEQRIKEFDYFISHSYLDSSLVQELIIYENSIGKNVFCDWISDSDYLKRNLICDATLKVLENRLEQSKCLLFVDSNNSRHSVWCKYELNYFKELGKPMYIITINDIENGSFDVKRFLDKWYLDPAYKELALIESTKVIS